MSMKDIREFLMKQMAELADSDATPEQQASVIERAKASSQVATTYIAAVKTEIDAIRLFDDTGKLPQAVEAPSMPGRVVALEHRRSAA